MFDSFTALARALGCQVTNTAELRVLGAIDSRTFLSGALSDLHVITWKFVVLHMVHVDTEGAPFNAARTWAAAVIRQQGRLQAQRERWVSLAATEGRLSDSDMGRAERAVAPLATVDEVGELHPSAPWQAALAHAHRKP